MSGHGFHVHGPHDHEVEHVTQHGGDSFTARLAVLTAVLSTIGAIFGYMGGHSQNAALLYKNEAAIQKTSASNQWNYYQAKSNKQNLAELSITLTSGEVQERYRQEVERYKHEKTEIKAEADKLEAVAREADKKSEAEMHVHERWALRPPLRRKKRDEGGKDHGQNEAAEGPVVHEEEPEQDQGHGEGRVGVEAFHDPPPSRLAAMMALGS